MTFKECLKKFHDTFPDAEIDDYRPVCYEMFQANKEGMTIWLKNGDMVVYHPKQEERMKSDYLKFLPQYHFDRDAFCECFRSVFSDDELLNIEDACQAHRTLSEFILYYDEGEYYIIHLPSGTMINWYKHLGRTNTCSKEGFTLDDLREFLLRLKDDLSE